MSPRRLAVAALAAAAIPAAVGAASASAQPTGCIPVPFGPCIPVPDPPAPPPGHLIEVPISPGFFCHVTNTCSPSLPPVTPPPVTPTPPVLPHEPVDVHVTIPNNPPIQTQPVIVNTPAPVNIPAPAPVSTTNNNTAPSGSGQSSPIIVTLPNSPQQLPAPAQTPVTPGVVTIVERAHSTSHKARRHHRRHRRHRGHRAR